MGIVSPGIHITPRLESLNASLSRQVTWSINISDHHRTVYWRVQISHSQTRQLEQILLFFLKKLRHWKTARPPSREKDDWEEEKEESSSSVQLELGRPPRYRPTSHLPLFSPTSHMARLLTTLAEHTANGILQATSRTCNAGNLRD